MSSFHQYVAGKSIAIVGPAPMPYDQSAEIDSHDLVYRPAHSPIGGHYGNRINIVYLNAEGGRKILDAEYEHMFRKIRDAAWWVNKSPNHQYRPSGFQRNAHKPPKCANPNAVTGMLYDLTHFHPASITVYGADLYAGGPGNVYHEDYDRREAGGQASGVMMHLPWQQRKVHQAVYATGLVRGDDRYVAAVTMSDDEYAEIVSAWATVYEQHQAAISALT